MPVLIAIVQVLQFHSKLNKIDLIVLSKQMDLLAALEMSEIIVLSEFVLKTNQNYILWPMNFRKACSDWRGFLWKHWKEART